MSEEKTKTEQLRERIMLSENKGVKALDAEEIARADEFCEGYKSFLNSSPVEREAVAEALEQAKAKGFAEYDPEAEYKAGDKVYLVNRGKAIALAVIGKNGVKNGARLAIAHIDSPRIDLKPNPLYEANGLGLFKTHYYGGLKKYQWTAIPLTLHGVVVKTDGTVVNIKWGDEADESCFCVTDLLPHLAQEQVTKPMAKAFTGEDLNVLVGSRPLDDADDEKELVKLNIMKILNDKY
nr:aminopeptidase [Ruminococcus sp.]